MFSVCIYCGGKAGLWLKICRDCKTLLKKVEEISGHVGYGQFLSELEQTGVAPEKIMTFMKADPEGKGSIQDKITAEMTTELMKVMGIQGTQTVQEVKRIRESFGKTSKQQ